MINCFFVFLFSKTIDGTNDGSLGLMGFFLMKKSTSFIHVGCAILINGHKLGNFFHTFFYFYDKS